MFSLLLMTYTLFNGYTSYMPPQPVGRFDTMEQCGKAAKEADFLNVKSANEIRFAFLCLETGSIGPATVAKQP